MSCVVGFSDGVHITMGGDSAGVDRDTQALQLGSSPKVFHNGPYLVGVVGNWHSTDILRYASLPEVWGESVDEFMSKYMLLFLGQIIPKSEEPFTEILIGIQGKLYHFYGAHLVVREQLPFEAIGCGAQIARGALYAQELEHSTRYKKVLTALEAAERFSAGVRGPFTTIDDERK